MGLMLFTNDLSISAAPMLWNKDCCPAIRLHSLRTTESLANSLDIRDENVYGEYND